MRRWAFTLSGLIVWAVHFLGVYAISSLADVVSRSDASGWRLAGLGFSVACVAAQGVVINWALRRLQHTEQEPDRFLNQLALLGGAIGLVASVWQSLPALIGH